MCWIGGEGVNKLVICNYADKCKNRCSEHGYPHEVKFINLSLYKKQSCTQWGECLLKDEEGETHEIKVRCVGVKE